jgi:hypothetical protein
MASHPKQAAINEQPAATAADWRAAAEENGRAAFETAITEPPTPAPPAWWESKGKDSR